MEKMTFALFFGNRGFFPESLIDQARSQIKSAVEQQGYGTLMLDESRTRYGAVETADEGRCYAAFLKENRDRYDGVILSLPNFGDENGAIAALQDCQVPILIQAYPDEIGKMDFEHRRDAFCGKFSVMDVFYQYQLPFTVFEGQAVHPETPSFDSQLADFAAVCRIVKKMKRFTVGAIGARTTAFKTVRFDELTLQRYGITTETLDLSELFLRIRSIDEKSDTFTTKRANLLDYTRWTGVPAEKIDMIARAGVAIDDIVRDYKLDCLSLRCWDEIEKELRIAPCVLLSELNDRGLVAACELDVCNAVAMYGLAAASQQPATCLDWNNNYGDDPDRCILFHCGPVPQKLMTRKGLVIEHKMFAKGYGAGCGWGCNVGRIAPSPITLASSKTDQGKLVFYLDEGRFTEDPIEDEFFGCGGVAEISQLQKKLLTVGKQGFRHHVGVTFGHVAAAYREAMKTYLNYDLIDLI
jgi:L-fucose isomerase-like protein